MFGRRSKLAIAAAAAAIAALALTGCGRSAGPGGAADAGSIDDSPATGELNIWAQADEAAALPAFAQEFMAQNPGLTINVTPLPWDAAHSKYQTAIASGTTPDMAQMGTTWMTDFSDAFAPVPKGIDTSGFFEGSLATNKVGDTLYGIPWYVDTRVFYYRLDLAEQAGWSKPPATWDEFTQFTKDMQAKAGARWGVNLPVGTADAFQGVLFFPWSAGAQLTNADQTAWTLDSPEMIRGMEYYQSFFTEGIANPNPDTGAGAAESAFVSGQVPVLVAGPSGIGSITKAGGGDAYKDKIGVMPVPKDKTSTSFTGGSNTVVFKNGKNTDAAWKFIRWLSQPDVQVRWQQAVGDLPSVQSAWNDPALANDRLLSVFGEQLKSTDSPPTLTTWTEVSSQADKAVETIARGGGQPADVMANLQQQAASIGTGKK